MKVKKLLTLMILILIITIGTQVKATEITPSTPKGYTFQYDSCNNYYCNGINDPIINSTGLQDYGTSTNINTSNYNYVFRNGVVNTYNFNSSNTYTINYRIHLGGNSSGIKTINTFQLYNNWEFTVLGYKNANDGYLDDYINSSSCSVRFDNSTNNGYLVSCNVALNVNVSRINIQTIFYNQALIQGGEYLNYDFSSVRVNLINIIENEGQGAIIDKQTNQLIDNQNKNTENIINNQNKNTENIINNYNNLMGDKCQNLFGDVKVINGWIDGTTWNIHSVGNNRVAVIPCEANTTYKITRQVKTSIFRVGAYDNATLPTPTTTATNYTIENVIQNNDGTVINYTTGANAKWLLIHFGHITTDSTTIADSYESIMVVKGTTVKPYCKFGSYTSKLDQTHTYNNTASEVIGGGGYIEQQENLEQGILNSIDVSGASNLQISMGAETTSWIWEIIGRLRNMNGYIILIMTSALGLGIIKMILNR